MAKLYTACIYNSLKIRRAMPDAKQVCIQRRPWRYIRKDAEVIRFPTLGPPIELHRYAQEVLRIIEEGGADESEIVNFQAYYAARYINYLSYKVTLIDRDTIAKTPHAELQEVRRYLFDLKKDVVLECSCPAGQFCHRLLLYHLLIDWFGLELAGGELELKEGK